MYSHTHVQQQLKRFFLNKNAEAGHLTEKIRERERESGNYSALFPNLHRRIS